MNKDNIIFKFKKSYHIANNATYFCCVGNSAVLYDAKSGAMNAEFKDMKHPSFSAFTSDDRLIVKTTSGEYYIYDLVDKTLIKKLKQPEGVKGSTTNFLVTADNKYILDSAHIFPQSKLMVMEIETGEYTLYDLNGARTSKILQSENNGKYYVASNSGMLEDEKGRLHTEIYSFVYSHEDIDLQKISVPAWKDFSKIDYNLGKLAMDSCDNIICIYDMNTKRENRLHFEKEGVLYDLKWSKNGKYIALAQTHKISVFDVEAKKCIKSYDVDYGCFAEFCNNDTELLIGTWERGCCITLQK